MRLDFISQHYEEYDLTSAYSVEAQCHEPQVP